MAASRGATSSCRALRTPKRADKSSPPSSQNFMERLPSEVLIKILSYLDAGALFSISHVSRRLHRSANDNALWKKIYIAQFGVNKACVGAQDGAAGSWKRLYLGSVAARDLRKWRGRQGAVSRHTGLPGQQERILRNLRVTWELTVGGESGRESVHGLSWRRFCETCVCLSWSGGGRMPSYRDISTLRLHGVRRIALNCPGLEGPGCRSLVAKLDAHPLTESMQQVIGQDALVELRPFGPGVIVGLWKDRSSVAFVMATLHLHRFLERSVDGSPVCPYLEPSVKAPPDDVDPEYGLHGYQLHIALHNTLCEIMSASFSQLFCRQSDISDGLIELTAISSTDISGHTPLSGDVSLPWRCEALQGRVQNCCIMSVTLLDEFRRPFWCVCSPVSIYPEETAFSSYDYDGQHFLIRYEDSDGQVKMKLVWMERRKVFVLTHLAVCVTVAKVNSHFSRNY